MHRSHFLLLGAMAWSIGCAAPAGRGGRSGVVRPGIEVLLTDSAALVRDRRVGLVTNQSGVDASGVSDVVRLRAAGVRLVALFSPEHGFRGAADPGAAVASSVDSATGLPIYSLYGRTSAPTDEMLSGIDVLLVDLQDAGARYYTYLTTTVDVMRAAGPKGIPVVVLDRPESDRRGGAGERAGGGSHHRRRPARRADAPRPDPGRAGPAGPRGPGPCRGARRGAGRGMAAGLPPSTRPACRSFLPAPISGPSRASSTIRGSACSRGPTSRWAGGQMRRSSRSGAPWLDTAAVLGAFRRGLAAGGASASGPVHPAAAGRRQVRGHAGGRDPARSDRSRGLRSYRPPRSSSLRQCAARIRDEFGWIPKHFDRLAGTTSLRDRNRGRDRPGTIVESWGPARQAFLERRKAVLLYPE